MKIKKSLLLSTFVMALVLVVTIVSISAAWFGDTLYASNKISILTELPEGEIVISTTGRINKLDDKLVPAITNKGWMLTSETSYKYNIDPTDKTLVGEGKPLESAAKWIYIYFPIYGVGQSGADDGKLPAIIEITGAYIPKDSAIEETEDSINYLEDFYISIKVGKSCVEDPNTGKVTWKEWTSNTQTITNEDGTTKTIVSPEGMSLNDGKIYWKYNATQKKLGILMDQGTTCYIRVAVRFNRVDVEVPPELIDTLVRFTVNIPQSPTREDVYSVTDYVPEEE